MKTDIIVQRAKTVINDLGLLYKIKHLKRYTNVENRERHSENDLRKYIYSIAENDQQRNYLFVNKVLKQIDLMLL
jgi:hypothetical protein